jgi:hypothetical protein
MTDRFTSPFALCRSEVVPIKAAFFLMSTLGRSRYTVGVLQAVISSMGTVRGRFEICDCHT